MSKILRIAGRYAVTGLLTLFGITLLSFLLGHIAPGDPAYAILASDGVDAPSDEQLAMVRRELGLDRSFFEQYILWVGQLLRGNIGVSFMTSRSIEHDLLLRIPVTLQLSLLAMAILVLISLPLGYLLALHKDSLLDRFFLGITSLFSAIPGFLVAIILMLIFAEGLRLLPTSGFSGFSSLILPAVSISLSSTMMITRVFRSDLLSVLGEEYFEMARSKGFSYKFSVAKHAIPNAFASIVSLWGNYFVGILGGSTIAESIFALPGLGQWVLKSINSHDYPAVQAYVLVMGIICLIVFLLADILQMIVQPQLRRLN